MELARPQRKRRALSLTPLIDVVFLLLVFFMLASTFLKFGTVKIETAGGGSESLPAEQIALIHVGPALKLRINGVATTMAGLGESLPRLLVKGHTKAVIVVQRGASVSDLIAATTEVRKVPFKSVRVVQ